MKRWQEDAMYDKNTRRRILSQIVVDDGNECWQWTGVLNRSGYGQLSFRGRSHIAHRVVWTVFRGDIPPGMVVDHVCRNKTCVNPRHLEVVTPGENVRRGVEAKFTPEVAREIKDVLEGPFREFMERFNCNAFTLAGIIVRDDQDIKERAKR